MHPRLSAHTIGFGARPFDGFAAELDAVGIARIGVPIGQLEAGRPAANRAALRGFEVVDLVQPSAFTVEEPSRWPAEQDRLARCVELAAEVGASVLYLTTGPAPHLEWDDAVRRFADAIGPVVARANEAGVVVAVENTNPLRADLSFVHRLADVVDLAAIAGVAVCADLFSAWTERDLAGTVARGAGSLVLVQLADYVLGTLQTPDRAVPGDGDVPIERQLRYLADAGYDGPIEAELIGPRIDAEGPAAALARGLATLSSHL